MYFFLSGLVGKHPNWEKLRVLRRPGYEFQRNLSIRPLPVRGSTLLPQGGGDGAVRGRGALFGRLR